MMMVPSIPTGSVRIHSAICGAAAVAALGGRFEISVRVGLEFRFAACTAEQHLVAVMCCAMGCIRLHRHAADGIFQIRFVGVGVRHGALRACVSSSAYIPYGGIITSTQEGYIWKDRFPRRF